MASADGVIVRNTRPEDIEQIQALSKLTYSRREAWTPRELQSHLRIFPEGQFVAIEQATGRVVGMAASLIVLWDDYELDTSWIDFTDDGLFTNHDPEHGRTLYGAEVMVHSDMQGRGVGKKLYAARRQLCRRLGLLRIR
ncbi:MAG: GNAT family N-acetyltransferase, partial [Phycisphaeraceae bacterium]